MPLTAVWLLTLLAPRLAVAGPARWTLAACWPFQFFLPGTTPISSWAPPQVMIPLSAVGALLLFALFTWTAATPAPGRVRLAQRLRAAWEVLGGAPELARDVEPASPADE